VPGEFETMETGHKFCIVVGGGMCGIAVSAYLVRRKILPYEDFMIIDRQDDYGGTWQANKYPGAACDIVSHCYAMRFHLKPGTMILGNLV
jgi:cation diffusion facilitator CzcD-associated flavoprotein CzcO